MIPRDFDLTDRKTQAGLAASVWLVFAAAVLLMPQTARLLTLALASGAVLVASVYELNKKEAGRTKLLSAFALAWLVVAATLYAANRLAPPDAGIEGPLVAGNAGTPPTVCGADAGRGGLLMIFGRDGVIGKGDGPFMPVRIGTCPALGFARTKAGLMVNGFGFDSDDNLVYRIRDNRFEQVLGGFLKERRPDRSTLMVVDDRGRAELTIRYLNPNALQVWGTFRCGGTAPVWIGDGKVTIAGVALKPRCAAMDSKTPFAIAYQAAGR